MIPAADFICGTVKQYIGCSTLERCNELAEFCARGVDVPEHVRLWMSSPNFSNCAFFALAVWKAVGVKHDVLSTPYKTQMAMAWVIQIGHDLDAVKKYPRDGLPVAGALMMYFTPGKNNHHVEFALTDATRFGVADHAGGGRPHCAITEGRSNIRWSNERPLQYWFDPELLLDVEHAQTLTV
jgi:hypothetical protein